MTVGNVLTFTASNRKNSKQNQRRLWKRKKMGAVPFRPCQKVLVKNYMILNSLTLTRMAKITYDLVNFEKLQ
jgi:hypothetical protein